MDSYARALMLCLMRMPSRRRRAGKWTLIYELGPLLSEINDGAPAYLHLATPACKTTNIQLWIEKNKLCWELILLGRLLSSAVRKKIQSNYSQSLATDENKHCPLIRKNVTAQRNWLRKMTRLPTQSNSVLIVDCLFYTPTLQLIVSLSCRAPLKLCA